MVEHFWENICDRIPDESGNGQAKAMIVKTGITALPSSRDAIALFLSNSTKESESSCDNNNINRFPRPEINNSGSCSFSYFRVSQAISKLIPVDSQYTKAASSTRLDLE
jgi:hypothetical protein